eukprot:345848_1
MSVPKKYIDEYNEFKATEWSRNSTQQRKFSPYQKHRKRPQNRTHSTGYYYVPFIGRDATENEKGTVSSMNLINDPALLKNSSNLPVKIYTYHSTICFFKIRNLTENYLVNLNDNTLKVVTAKQIANTNRMNLNTIPIRYLDNVMQKYNISKPLPLNKFYPSDLNLTQPKLAMSSFILKEIGQQYEKYGKKSLNADFMCAIASVTRICHVILSNIKPKNKTLKKTGYKLHDPLHVLIWSEKSIPSIDPAYWNKNVIQLHHITTEDRYTPDLLAENPNSMYGELFEHILTSDKKTFKHENGEWTDESNAFAFSKMKLCADDKTAAGDEISLLLASEQDCRISKSKLAEIKLSKMYENYEYGGVILDRDSNIRIPFWKFMSYWLQCYFGNKNDLIIGFHKNGKIIKILKTNFDLILAQNKGLIQTISFVKYALFEVLTWVKSSFKIHSDLGPLVLKTQLAIDAKGNEYNQFIIKAFGGECVSKLELRQILEYGQKTHNIYFDEEKETFNIEQVDFNYVENIVKVLNRDFFQKRKVLRNLKNIKEKKQKEEDDKVWC